MTDDNESGPWASWAIKGMILFFVTVLQVMAIITLIALVPWMPMNIIGLTILLSGVVFLAGNVVLLESKNARMWGYSMVAGFAIGVGSIVLSTLWMLTFIPVPLVGNAFYAVMIVIAVAGFAISWFKTSPTRELHTGMVTASPSSISTQMSAIGRGIFQQKPEMTMAVELKEIHHDYAFAENSKYTPLEIIQRFYSVARSMTTTPYGFRIQRSNCNTRILYFTWSNDESLLNHHMAVLNDALQHNLPGFRLEPVANFTGITLDVDEQGSAAVVTGIPLSIQDEKQLKDPLEAMTGVLQSMENGVYQVFIEPMTVNKSKLRSLERQYKQAIERSETTISKEKSGWLGTHQESKLVVNIESKKEAELLERQIRRWSDTDLFKTTVTVIAWDKDSTRADFDVRRLVSPLMGGIRSDNTQDTLRFGLTTKRKHIERLLAGFPHGNSSILTAEELTVYTIISRKDADVRVTKREKFSAGTKEPESTPVPRKEEAKKVTSLVSSLVNWIRRTPTIFFGNPIDESGNILPKSFVTSVINFLKMHLAVLGHTQSGKSTTIRSIFGQAVTLGVNPIMFNPTKSHESRLFIHLFEDTRIFTCGRSDLVSLLFNLWNPPKNVPLSKWVDRVVQAWTLWLPNDPVISMHFEKVVYTMYKKCGWNLKTNSKGRPILITDLIEALEEEEQKLQYGVEVSSNIFGALIERVRSILRKHNLVGIFNTKTGITVDELLAHPTIIDMDALSGNDKILLMGILTAEICEYKLSNPTKEVTNLLILEEAHYLLGGFDETGEAHSGAKLQAIAAFIEMLRVVGGTGLGVIIADQSPTSLAPQVMKIVVNIIIHALPNDTDRKLVGSHTRCTDTQMDHIGGMGIGEAIVYLQNEGEPKHVKILTLDRFVEGEFPDDLVSDETLAQHMKTIIENRPHLQDSEPLPDDSGDKIQSKPKVNKAAEEEHIDPIGSELLRIIKTPIIASFVKRALQKEDYSAISKQLQTIANTHGDGSRDSVMRVLKLLIREYGNQGNMDRFGKLTEFMIGEGSEGSRRRPEGQDEDEQPEVDEKPQTAKEVLDELRPEIENKPSEPEETEPPPQEPFWYPETAEPCVRDATKEFAWKEDMEREREEEKERERERSRQEREANVERENFDDLEKELQKALEDYGVDPEDFKAKWRDQFVKDIEEYLNEQPEKQDNDSNEEDIEGTSGQKSDVERASQHDAGSGQMYELETTPSVESDTEAETEPQSEPVVDTQEPETSPESEPPKERVQPPLEKSEPSSEPDAVPREHERPSSKEDVEEPEIEHVPAEKPSNKTKSVEDTVIQEKANPRTEQTTVEIPQETSKSEKEIESDETKVEAETETSELETKVNETKEEVETESQEPEQVDDSEDLAWQEQLMQIYNETPEEWREVFREYLRGLVEDEEDLRRLLEKHGLEYILEDEEQMDEVRKFLEFKEALREQGKENLESIAEELEIDMEQAEQWASGEVEPQIIVDVLNLEAYWSFWELLRLNAERDFPESVKDLEEILQDNPMLELADPTLPFELWKKDAKAWVEIMGMKKRGEIRTKLRNGREIYHREDIERLSAKYSLPKAEIISWLRGEKAPPLIRKIGKKKLKKQIIGDTSHTKEMNPILYSPKGSDYSVEDIRRLYYDEGLSKSEVARSLGIANSTVHRVFEKNKWKSLPAPKKGDPEQAYKLSQLGLTHIEIAERMGVSPSTAGNYLRELGVQRKFLTDSERKQKRKEKSRKVVENAKALRDKLFGTKCRICGATREKRSIAIHNKDFKEHKLNALWRPSFLQKVNPEEWAALCIMCHRGVHWVHDDLGMNWEDIERLFRNLDFKDDTQTRSSSKPRLTDLPASSKAEIEKLRKKLFGDECYFCGPIPEGKNKVIHRKDGKPHPREALKRKKFLLQMNPDEWVMVCQKHHRYVHWAMKNLGLSWKKIEKSFKKSQ